MIEGCFQGCYEDSIWVVQGLGVEGLYVMFEEGANYRCWGFRLQVLQGRDIVSNHNCKFMCVYIAYNIISYIYTYYKAPQPPLLYVIYIYVWTTGSSTSKLPGPYDERLYG